MIDIQEQISRCLAQAVEYLKDKDKALDSYNRLCRVGGSKSYPEILSAAGLEPSYNKGRVKNVMEKVKAYLENN